MEKRSNLTITLLCVSAFGMAAVLALVFATDSSDAGESVSNGHFIMFTSTVPGNRDMLYVIDRRTQKMNMYTISGAAAAGAGGGNVLGIADQIDLAKAFR